MVGARYGSYVIERELGRGGMGIVYAARHSILGHHVALKILHSELSQREDVVQRFFNEARAAAAIDHPGIVAVHDVGIADDRSAYLVMELLPGESLAEHMRAHGALAPAAAIACVRQIADALGAAHAAGIVHRDLKPDNIFLVPDQKQPYGLRVLLLDFGVAKLTGELSSGDLKTKTGALLGTPHYMSPEQCDGERPVDHRSDLYSLGCVLFQMVSGKLPFEGGIGAVIGMHIHVPPPPLVAPPAVAAIAARLMQKDPAARFGSAAELIAAIDAWTPAPADHSPTQPAMPMQMAIAATLPASSPSEPFSPMGPTHVSYAPQSRENAIRPRASAEAAMPSADVPRRSRRGVLMVAAVLGLAGIAVAAYAVTRTPAREAVATAYADAAPAQIDAAVAIAPDVAAPEATRATDAAIVDAHLAMRDATARDAQLAIRDAGTRDATVVVQVESDAGVDAGGIDLTKRTPKPEPSIDDRFARVPNLEHDFDASMAILVLELVAAKDPRMKAARDAARTVIKKTARDENRMKIHLALVDHDWQTGLDECLTWGEDPRVDIRVPCTVFACVLDHEKLQRWAGSVGWEPTLKMIGTFCERYRKP